MMHLDEIIRRFDNPKSNGANNYMVRCPCHDDSTQSLSITEKDDKILMNCFAGCRTGDILWAVGLQERDLFNTASTPDRPPSVEYLYTPDLKKVRFYVLKNGEWKKTFCWKHRNADGSWDKGTGGLHIPLYRQNQLEFTPIVNDEPLAWDDIINEPDAPQAAALPPVYIVEGEKDADTMNDKLGLVAVSSPHGGTSGKLDSKWHDEWNSLFADRDVVLLPDNDEVGEAFADLVARKLISYAKSVKIVRLKEEWDTLPKKGDITDVLSIQQPYHGKNVVDCVRDKLEALTICTPAFDPKQAKEAVSEITPSPEDEEPEWEKPIPFDDSNLPPFPVEALPSVIRNFVLALSESTQTPVDMCASACLAVLALAIQGKYRIRGKADWFEPLNLYILNIARPSERKSAILSAAIKPVNTYESEYNERNALAIQESYNELEILKKKKDSCIASVADIESGKKQLKKDETADTYRRRMAEATEQYLNFKVRKSKKLYVDDITTEKLAEVLDEYDGRISLLSSEGGIFDILAGAYSKNVNIDVFLKAWSGDCIRVDRVGRAGNSIMNPTLTILLMVQPNVISGIVNNPKFRGKGLTARFLYCMPKSAVGHRHYRSKPMSEFVQAEYTELMYDLIDDELLDANVPRFIKLSPEADELLEAFSERIEPMIPKEPPAVAEWMGKLVGTTLRIAGILCRVGAADHKVHTSFADSLGMEENLDNLIVEGKTMAGAIAIGEYYLSHAQAAFTLMSADEITEKAEYVLGKIRRAHLTEFNHKKILDTCRSFKKVDDIKPVLKRLTEYGWLRDITPEWSGRGRKPEPTYIVNPVAFEGKGVNKE